MIKAIIFDWGGVLGPDNNRVAAKKLSKEFECNQEEIRKFMSDLEDPYSRGEPNDEYYKIVSEKFSIPEESIREALNDVPSWDFFSKIGRFKEKGFKIFLLSNQMTPRTQAIRASCDLSIFDEVFFSDEIRLMKPNADIFLYVLERIEYMPDETIFIDDNPHNIDTANAMGMNTVLFTTQEDVEKKLDDFLELE